MPRIATRPRSIVPTDTAVRRGAAARHSADRRAQILDAARALFLAEGFDHTSMRNIAARIRLSPTAIYLYFPDKHTLLHALGEQFMERLFPLFVAKWQTEPDPALRLRFVLDTFVDFGLANPAEYRLLFMSAECSIGQPGHRPAPGAAVDETDIGMKTFALMQEAIAEMIAQGRYRAGEPATMAELMWASCHGLITLLITHPHFPWSPREALIEGMHKLLLNGFAAPADDRGEDQAAAAMPAARKKSSVRR